MTQANAPLPRSFLQYLASFGPGIVVVLTWLGAGDLVEVGVAGGNYGYALIWAIVVALFMRFLFVSLIAKYQLCNQYQEGLVDGLARLHPLYPLVLLIATIVLGHAAGAYMTAGVGEACTSLTGFGQPWHWALFWNPLALLIILQPAYACVEVIFKCFLALLAISFVGTAVWIGPSFSAIAESMLELKLPLRYGPFDSLLIAVGMIGAVGGSLMNLVYPNLLEAKGWRGPQYRRVQLYDFLFAITVMVLLNLSIWVLGAELLHPRGLTIHTIEDLSRLLSETLGLGGRTLFVVGAFAAIFTSLVGISYGLALLASHSYLCLRQGVGAPFDEYKAHPCYRWIAAWCILSPLIWSVAMDSNFVALTLVVNAAQVALIPLLAGGIWWITASSKYIGVEYRNGWWENLAMAFFFVLAICGAIGAVQSVASHVGGN